MSSGKHQSRTTLDRLDAKTVKILIVAGAAVLLAVIILVTVLLVSGGGDEEETPTPGVTVNPNLTPGNTGDDTDAPGTQDPAPQGPGGVSGQPGTEEPGTQDPEDPEDDPGSEDPDSTQPTEPVYYNPLTGLQTETDITSRRPFAVMFNNLQIATPQSGIAAADILFEVPVEGGITRFMGVFQDFKGSLTLGSVRSARPYFVDLAMSFDAIYIHAGGSNDAYQEFKDLGIDRIDGVNGSGETFFRDENRMNTMGYEHSLMLDVTTLDGYLEKYSFRTTHGEGFGPAFTFDPEAERSGVSCNEVEAQFGGKSTSFAYDSDSGTYKISQYGGPMTDGLTGRQVSAKNVILLSVRITPISGDDAGRLKATLNGNGSGWIVSGGVAERITWTRTDTTSQFVFTNSEGDEISLAPGVTYIGLLPMSSGNVNFK